MEKRGQASVEFILLLGAVVFVGLLTYAIFLYYSETSDARISESRAYWSGVAYGLKIDEWNLAVYKDPNIPASEANLTVHVKNPLSEKIILRKIQIVQGNFGHIWFSDGTYAGHADDLNIILNPGDSLELIVQHYQNGADSYIPPSLYEFDTSIVYDTPNIESNVLNGSIPVIGKRDLYIENAVLDAFCPGGTAQCPAGSGDCCAPANCIDGVCTTNACVGVVCDIPECEICNVSSGKCYCTDATTPPNYYCNESKCYAREVRDCSGGFSDFDSGVMFCSLKLKFSIKSIPGFLPISKLPSRLSIFKAFAPFMVLHSNNV